MTKQVDVYLADILQSIALIEKYVANTPYSRIETDTETQDAIIRRLEIIGEAVKQLPDDVRAKHPHIPWKQIAGMRDVLIHSYANVTFERVWSVVQNDLEPLKQAVGALKEQG